MICHQIEALKEAGCDEVVLAINYRPQVMMDFLKEWEVKLGIKITCSQEPEPMGTAGPLALARAILDDGSGTPFFVLNSVSSAASLSCRSKQKTANQSTNRSPTDTDRNKNAGRHLRVPAPRAPRLPRGARRRGHHPRHQGQGPF